MSAAKYPAEYVEHARAWELSKGRINREDGKYVYAESSRNRSLSNRSQSYSPTATETDASIRSRIAVKPIVIRTAYSLVIWLSAVVSLVGLSLLDAGEPTLLESATLVVAFTPFIGVVPIAVSVTHYAVERRF